MKNLTNNFAFALNCLLVFLLLFGNALAIPTWLQVAGRMHPLLLHFPIVLLLIAAVFEIKNHSKPENTEGGILHNLGDWFLLTAALTAALSALFGLFLSQEEGYDLEAIAWHKWSGVSVSVVSFLWFSFRKIIRTHKIYTLLISMVSGATVILAGHQGANITHGAGFLLEPITPKNVLQTASVADPIIFDDLVKPILEKKCIGCHNDQKAKGELVMKTPAQLLRGGKNGKLWDSTSADLGLLMRRVHLPLAEKEHMPPIGKPQLTEEEIAILYHWLKNGGSFEQKISALAETDTLRILAKNRLKTNVVETFNFKAADEATVKKLNTNYCVVAPLALNSPALSVDFFGAAQFSSDILRGGFQDVKAQIVHLNLNKMPFKDEDVRAISSFTNLQKLNLSFTQITGATLSNLKSLKNLRQLSLSGTATKGSDLVFLTDLTQLQELQLWNTSVSENEIANLKTKFPKILIETGFHGESVVAKLSAPILENEDIAILKTDTKVMLKHYVKGTTIRYTLDGSDPDSLQSPVYTEGGIWVDKTATLKAKAYLDGWLSSDTLVQQFYKMGFVADSVRLVQAPHRQYSGVGKLLFDGKKGDINFKDGKWLGFKETQFESFLSFNTPITLSKVTFSTLVDIGSYIMPPKELQVWGGNSATSLTLLKTIYPTQPIAVKSAFLKGFDCSFAPKRVKVLKLVAKSVQKLPPWHPGKGDKGWFFVDELFLN